VEVEIYRGSRMRIEKSSFSLPDGSTRDRIVVRPGNAVAMLPIEGEFCYLIRQYRFAIGATIYEVPAGTIDNGETPEETAYRELIEETGMKAGTMKPVGQLYTTPGFTDEIIYLFEAYDLSPSDEYLQDEDEVIEVVKVHRTDVKRMMKEGTICDAKTICLLCRYLEEFL
jgi:ADP-ribose pyrophosphatase